MGNILQKITLNAELKNIWKFITDPENFPKYVYGYTHGKTTSPNATGIGASYEWYGKLGPFKLKSTEKIIGWQTIRLSRRAPELQLLQAVRDEAHRFAQRYHHKLIGKNLSQDVNINKY